MAGASVLFRRRIPAARLRNRCFHSTFVHFCHRWRVRRARQRIISRRDAERRPGFLCGSAALRETVCCRAADTTKAGPSDDAGPGFRLLYGDAGIRTRVRLLIHRDVYVRIPPFCSPRSLIGRQKAHREPAVKVSPAPSRRQTRASPNLSTPCGPPQAGLTAEWEVRSP